MTKTQRELILEVIYQVLEEGAYANIALDKALSSSMLENQSKGFVTEVVYGTVRFKKRIDTYFYLTTGRDIKTLDKRTRSIIRMSLYQLIFMPDIPKYAILNEAVELAKPFGGRKRKRDKFVNGVLREFLRKEGQCNFKHYNKLEALAIETSLPEWMIRKWAKMYNYDMAREIGNYMNEPAPLWIRVNTSKIDPLSYMEKLDGENISYKQHPHILEGIQLFDANQVRKLPGYDEGEFFVQDISSMHVAYAVNLNSLDKTIWDTCAAPGGKTTHIATLLKGQGEVLATDLYPHRVNLINENIERLDCNNIKTECVNALETTFSNAFDITLVDAPCSGLGVLNRRPDSRWRKSEKDIKDLIDIQIQLVHRAIEATRPGGQIIYSTCTINDAENDRVIKKILEQCPDVSLDADLSDRLYWLDFQGNEGRYEFLPPKDKTDGFYIASLIKES